MADNVAITAGVGTTVAADDIASVFYQRVKLSLGADGAAVDAVAGAGAVGTGVQRVTLASDDPAVTDLAAIEVLLTSMDSDTSRLTSSAGPVDAGAALATTAFMVGAQYNSAAPTFTDGQQGGLQISSAGKLLVADASAATIAGHLANALNGDYETVAASQTAQTLGATGGTGDFLARVLIIPATTSPGAVSILDGATEITIFTGGASSVSNLVPFEVPLNMLSASGAWKITTGANVSAIGVGNFT